MHATSAGDAMDGGPASRAESAAPRSGWRRAVVGLAVGAAVGMLIGLLLPHEDRSPER